MQCWVIKNILLLKTIYTYRILIEKSYTYVVLIKESNSKDIRFFSLKIVQFHAIYIYRKLFDLTTSKLEKLFLQHMSKCQGSRV